MRATSSLSANCLQPGFSNAKKPHPSPASAVRLWRDHHNRDLSSLGGVDDLMRLLCLFNDRVVAKMTAASPNPPQFGAENIVKNRQHHERQRGGEQQSENVNARQRAPKFAAGQVQR